MGVAALLVAVLVLLTQAVMGRASEADARQVARARAEGVAGALQLSGGHVRVAEGPAVDSDRSTWVVDRTGAVLDGSPHVPHEVVAIGLLHREGFHTQDEAMLFALPVAVGDRQVSVVSSVDLAPYERSERRTLWLTLALGLVTVVIAGGVAHEATRLSLRQVHRMSQRADEWQQHDLDHRFALGPPKDEITELGHTLDTMLARIAGALSDERRLTDELAHELRTPLTVVRSEAQLAQRGADPETHQALQRIVDSVDAMTGTIRTLLDAARARAHSGVTNDLGEVLRELGAPVTCPPRLGVAVPAQTLVAMLRPVLENARRHARGRVEVVGVDEDPVLVRVLDDGAGFSVEAAQRVFAVGFSGAGSSGLGLAVVRRIASGCGVVVRAVPGDGGVVELELPRL